MAECEQVRDLLWDYADGTLDTAARQSLEEHLKNCPRCRAELEEIRALRAALHSLDESPPKNLHAEIMRAVANERAKRRKTARLVDLFARRPYATVAAAAALFIVIAGGSVWAFVARGAKTGDLMRALSSSVAAQESNLAQDAEGEDTGGSVEMAEEKDEIETQLVPNKNAGSGETASVLIPDIALDGAWRFIIVCQSPAAPKVLSDTTPAEADGYLLYTVSPDLRSAIESDLSGLGVVYSAYDTADGGAPIDETADAGLVIVPKE